MSKEIDDVDHAIAIIGLAGRFPGAQNIQTFWGNLCQGIESISTFSVEELSKAGVSEQQINASNYVKARGILEDIEFFDADFFGYSPKEAEITDPQHRLFLECAWESLENAGYCPDNYPGLIGVYAGTSLSFYYLNNIHSNAQLREELGEYLLRVGNEKDFFTTKVSYKLNLRGPSLAIQTACSTSLVSVCIACNHLLTYQCDMALAGGVSITVPQESGYVYQEGMIFSPDGHCRPFDSKAQGTVPGNGVGIVVLKRLQDALDDKDHIYAIIKGYGTNNDGNSKVGYFAPSVQGQMEAIMSAISMANIHPETITYIEAHGTGTLLGDPIEMKALTQTFQMYTQKTNYCAIGSIKSNIGHLMEAAGITSLIKTALAIHHGKLPPTLHFDNPNPHIDFANSPFYVNTTLQEWHSHRFPRRACVNSLGIGGTNAYVLMEEKPDVIPAQTLQQSLYLLVLSAKTATALKKMAVNLGHYLQTNSSAALNNVAYTLQVGRKAFEHRQIFIGRNREELIGLLVSSHSQPESYVHLKCEDKPSIVFIVTEQDTDSFYKEQEFYQTNMCYRKIIDEHSILLKTYIGFDLRHIFCSVSKLFEVIKEINKTPIKQCILFITQYALAKLWQEYGVHPQAMIGYGLGEYVVACLAGVFTIEDALKMVIIREKIVESMALEDKLAIPLSSKEKIIQIFDVAIREPLLLEFKSIFNQMTLNPPKIPYISSLTGSWMQFDEIVSFDYWAKLIVNTTSCSQEIQELFKGSNRILIEIGSDKNLPNSVKQYPSSSAKIRIIPFVCEETQKEKTFEILLRGLSQLWLSGIEINWKNLYQHEQPHRLPLPTYPFEKKRYWVEPPSRVTNHILKKDDNQDERHTFTTINKDFSFHDIEKVLLAIWKECLGLETIDSNDDFFKLGGDSILSIQIIAKIQERFGIRLQLNVLIEVPTIAQLTSLIFQKLTNLQSQSVEKITSPLLVRLKVGEASKKPLFFIHPISGHVFCYKPLADVLTNNQPIYAIQGVYQHLEQNCYLNSIEEMASYYIQLIREVQPEGPYHLLGASFGGLVAYEMARQMVDAKQSVNLLALLDIIKPDNILQKANSESAMLELLIELFEGEPTSLEEDTKHSLHDQMNRLMMSMKLEVLPFSEQQKILDLVKIYLRLLMNYKPKPYDGDVIFFQAKDKFFHMKDVSAALSWKDLIKGRLDVHDVSGNHLSMMMYPHVLEISQMLDFYFKNKE